jgi:hypothetical protein
MKKINFELAFASLIPDFVSQLLLSDHIRQDSAYCIELEDLRDSLKRVNDPEIADVKKFLSLEDEALMVHEHACGEDCDEEEPAGGDPKTAREALEDIDPELEEIDDEYYHIYTPAELRYIFDRINNSIDKLYKYYMDYSSVNLTLTVGFKFVNGLEAALVVEYFHPGLAMESPGDDAMYLPVKNPKVSDEISLRAYFSMDAGRIGEYEAAFKEVTDMLNVKHDDRYTKGFN